MPQVRRPFKGLREVCLYISELSSITSVARWRPAIVIQAPMASPWPVVAVQAGASARPVVVDTVTASTWSIIVETAVTCIRSPIIIKTAMPSVWPAVIIAIHCAGLPTVHIQTRLDMYERWRFVSR